MKRLVKTLMLLSWMILPYLMAACTSEVETISGVPEQPENPQANDPNRRSVVISLQNKLILVKGTPESRALTRDGIAEEDENHIESFDIYAFASDKEEGPYTFQERFAYRSEFGTLPAGASPLELKADEATGKVNVVFYPRKGLFTKFYCVANQDQMYDAAGHPYTNYIPLKQAPQQQSGTSADAVTAPGTPTESDFLNLNSPLLNPAGLSSDILLSPLPMSGANAQPTDLREYSMGTYVRLNISLTRAVARFDVVNNAAKSHFTITDIALGNGRQGVTLFPIRPTGEVPAAPGQLITYPYRPFDGLNANVGTTTKAFYCYPCKALDEGYLILKGLYAVNLTDEKKEVSYRIPFERVTDGNGSRIEINHNHRYTVQITEADPFVLKANIRLVDWETGGDVEDYEPDNGVEGITVTELLPVGETTYDVATTSVTLPVKAGSSFVATASSNGGIEAKLGYQGSTQSVDGWLKLEEIIEPATRAEGTKQAKFKVSINENYTGANYPRGVLRLIGKAGGGEEVILVNIDNTPLVKPIVGTMNPEGVNNWDASEKTLYLVQAIAGNESTGTITVVSKDGSKIEFPDDSGITVSPTSSKNDAQNYTFTWAGTDAIDVAEKEIKVTLKNDSDETKTESIKVKLLPNKIENLKLIKADSGISLSEVTTNSATLTIPIIKDRLFTITMDSYSNPTVTKCPAWLEQITPTTTRSTPENKTREFDFKLKGDATNFDDTQIVFNNAITVNITKVYQKPTITFVSADPVANSYISSSKTLNLFQLKANNYSTATLKVYSLGGSKLELPAGVEADLLNSTATTQDYVIKYKITSDSNLSLSDLNGGTLNVKNLSDESKSEAIAVKFKTSIPYISSSTGVSISRNKTDVDARITAHLETGGKTGFTFYFSSPVGYKHTSTGTSGNANTRTTVSGGGQTGSAGNMRTSFIISFNSGATFSPVNLYYYNFSPTDNRFPSYMIDLYVDVHVCKGKTAFNLNGLWVIPYLTGTWAQAVETGSTTGNGWRLASIWDYRTLVGWTGGAYESLDNVSVRTLNTETKYIQRIFQYNNGRHFSSQDLGGSWVRAMEIRSTSTGNYGTPLKSENQPYVLVRNE